MTWPRRAKGRLLLAGLILFSLWGALSLPEVALRLYPHTFLAGRIDLRVQQITKWEKKMAVAQQGIQEARKDGDQEALAFWRARKWAYRQRLYQAEARKRRLERLAAEATAGR
jgi:hypothetical protein